jgi:hypothetical protein
MFEMTRTVKIYYAFVAALAISSCPIVNAQEIDESDRAWVSAARANAIDHLLPPPILDEEVDLTTAWVAVIRVSPPDGSGAELYVRLTKYSSGKIKAHVVQLVNGSIAEQLSGIHLKRHDLSPAQAVALIQTRTRDVSDADVPALRDAAKTLERTRGEYVFDNVIMLDATRYELWTIGGPRRLYVTILGPSAADAAPKLPLLKTLRTIKRMVEAIP